METSRFVTFRDLLIALTSFGASLIGLVLGSWISLNQVNARIVRRERPNMKTGFSANPKIASMVL